MDNHPHHRQRYGPGKVHPGWRRKRVHKSNEDGASEKNDLNIKGLRKALGKTDETRAHFCRNSSFHGQSVKLAEDYMIVSEKFSVSSD